MEGYAWIVEADSDVRHKRPIGFGGYGEVHEVISTDLSCPIVVIIDANR